MDNGSTFLRETLPQQGATTLSDMQPAVLQSASFRSPLLDSTLDRASSRVEQLIETMASYRGAKTPQLDEPQRRNPQGALKDIIRVGCMHILAHAVTFEACIDQSSLTTCMALACGRPISLVNVCVQEKETELASIAAQRSRALAEQLERVQEQERKGKEEISKLRSQLKQLTKDFQYNLDLLKDRDTELGLLENQIKAHKETAETRSQELANAVKRIDEAKVLAARNETRAEEAAAQKAAIEERCANRIAVLQRENAVACTDLAAQLEAANSELQQVLQLLLEGKRVHVVGHKHPVPHEHIWAVA